MEFTKCDNSLEYCLYSLWSRISGKNKIKLINKKKYYHFYIIYKKIYEIIKINDVREFIKYYMK